MTQAHRPRVFSFVAWIVEHSPIEGSVLQSPPRGCGFDARRRRKITCASNSSNYFAALPNHPKTGILLRSVAFTASLSAPRIGMVLLVAFQDAGKRIAQRPNATAHITARLAGADRNG